MISTAPRTIRLTTPLDRDELSGLRAGDLVLLSGVIYTARDAAHKHIFEALERGDPPPFKLEGAVIYYVGPTPSPPGLPIGSAGPTTAYRMDSFTPRLHQLGLAASIGKGKRSREVRDALRQYGAIYFGATGGAGALLSRHITASEMVAYPDLGTEAVRRLTLRDFPLLVIYDSQGGDIFPTSPKRLNSITPYSAGRSPRIPGPVEECKSDGSGTTTVTNLPRTTKNTK